VRKRIGGIEEQNLQIECDLFLVQKELSDLRDSISQQIRDLCQELSAVRETPHAPTENSLREELVRLDKAQAEFRRDLTKVEDAQAVLRNELSSLKEDVKVRRDQEDLFRKDLARLKQQQQSTTLEQSILQRTLSSQQPTIGRKFTFGSDSLSGIVAFLTEKCGGNVHEKGVVEVTSSSVYEKHVPQNATDLKNNLTHFWLNGLKTDEWICFNFKDLKIEPTHYTMRAYNSPGNWHQPKNWVLQGSNDEVS
jgi:hypothetical protein